MHPYSLAALDQGDFIVGAFALIAGSALGVLLRLYFERVKRISLDKELESMKATAQSEAEKIVAVAEAKAKSEFINRREQFDQETDQTRKEMRAEEKRLAKREDFIDQKLETLNSKERNLSTAEKAIQEKEKSLAGKDRHLNDLIAQQKTQLLKVANLSMDEARKVVLEQVEREMDREVGELIQRKLEQAHEESENKAREITVNAIQRYAAEHTCDATVSTVSIPSDDMKGRVIGREGRNIRSFEKVTGVDVIVDDTPGVVVVSAFDPVRREIARRSLERLIQDGRIHPTRIEEIVASTEREVQKQIYEEGKRAMLETKARGLHNKLMELVGRLHFRTSYGQNILQHSLEVAHLSGLIAEELGFDGQLARRCGLLHDIGKAVDHEVEGGHPEIGADLLKRYGEREEVINAAGAHHGDLEAKSIYTPIVAAADAISASRPGARRESLERYVQRLQKLEEIATAFEGVKQAYAIQAGREVRVIVDPSGVDDRLCAKIARDVARRVEEEMQYPGEVKVTLVREVRCVEYAR